jgi:hypothetical protein
MAKSVVLDANLLVLLVAGYTDKSLIERHKISAPMMPMALICSSKH